MEAIGFGYCVTISGGPLLLQLQQSHHVGAGHCSCMKAKINTKRVYTT